MRIKHISPIFLVFTLLFTSNAYNQDHAPISPQKGSQNNYKSKKSQLEITKLEYEVAKLKNETANVNYNSKIQAGTLIAAIIAAITSFWAAWKTSNLQSRTLRDQRHFNKQERMHKKCLNLAHPRTQ